MDRMDKMIATVTVTMGHSEWGTPRPQLEIRLPRNARWRQGRALLHSAAAAAELATPLDEAWCIEIEHSGDLDHVGGWVCAELATGTEAEVARAIAVLQGVARGLRNQIGP